MPTAEAIAISGDRIMAVGSTKQMMALRGTGTRLIDLRGRTVLPGFIDAHSHIIGDRAMVDPDMTVAEAARSALKMGWTGVSELFVDQARLDELLLADQRGELGLRVNTYLPVNYLGRHDGIWFDHYAAGERLSDRVRLAGAKLFVDPADPVRMYLSEPHLGHLNPTYRGEVYWTQDELTGMVIALHERGWQVAAHSVGDGAHDLILNAFESALAGESNERRRHRIEHLLVLRDDQISRMALLRIVASIQFTSTTSDLPTDDYWEPLVPSLGGERLGLLARWRDLLDADVPMTGSTDTPWEPATPMLAVYQAVTRIGPSGAAPMPWMEAQRITVTEALRLLTIDAAWGTNEEDARGSLSPGKLADLVVVSDNPLGVPVDVIPRIAVMMTMVGGQIWHCPSPCFGPVPF